MNAAADEHTLKREYPAGVSNKTSMFSGYLLANNWYQTARWSFFFPAVKDQRPEYDTIGPIAAIVKKKARKSKATTEARREEMAKIIRRIGWISSQPGEDG